MVARTATTTSTKQTVVTPAVEKKYVVFEATVSTDNTIPIDNLSTISGVALLKKSDGSTVTCTVATNIITVTQASLTDVPVLGIAYGA
jgi:hypothetical protein